MRDLVIGTFELLGALAGLSWVAFGALLAPTPEESGRAVLWGIVGFVGAIALAELFSRRRRAS